jgi:histidinol-phosphate aminotransferase
MQNPALRLCPQVAGFTPYVAGLSIDEIKERYGLTNVVKLASNENPLGASPLAVKAIRRAAELAFRYPQHGAPRLNRAVAGWLGVDEGRVVTGNGSDELIDLLVRVKARPGIDNILAFRPCFSIYELQARLCGVELRQAPLRGDFSLDFEALLALADGNTAICFVTTPDNPSGYAPPVDELEGFARRLPPDCLLVVDEAYMDFAAPQEAFTILPRLSRHPNVAVIRTFSKMFGLAGVRCGMGVLPQSLAEAVQKVKPPFSVSLLAEEAALAALRDEHFIRCTLETVAAGREQLAEGLGALGCRVAPSQANFLLFTLPVDAGAGARECFEALLRQGIIIRPLASYGLDDALRVSVGTERENRLFLEAMAGVLGRK